METSTGLSQVQQNEGEKAETMKYKNSIQGIPNTIANHTNTRKMNELHIYANN